MSHLFLEICYNSRKTPQLLVRLQIQTGVASGALVNHYVPHGGIKAMVVPRTTLGSGQGFCRLNGGIPLTLRNNIKGRENLVA